MIIAAVSYEGFFIFYECLYPNTIREISFVDILQLNAFVLFLFSPFLLFNKHLSDRANRTITLLQAVRRDRDRLSFWVAQANENKQTNKSRIAPTVLDQLNTNSAADISLKMMHSRRSWRRAQTDKMPDLLPPEITARLDDLEKAIKNLTPTKSE